MNELYCVGLAVLVLIIFLIAIISQQLQINNLKNDAERGYSISSDLVPLVSPDPDKHKKGKKWDE